MTCWEIVLQSSPILRTQMLANSDSWFLSYRPHISRCALPVGGQEPLEQLSFVRQPAMQATPVPASSWTQRSADVFSREFPMDNYNCDMQRILECIWPMKDERIHERIHFLSIVHCQQFISAMITYNINYHHLLTSHLQKVWIAKLHILHDKNSSGGHYLPI